MAGLKTNKPVTPSKRHHISLDLSFLAKKKAEKSLTKGMRKKGGRDNKGRVSVRHQGGGAKRLYRKIDFKREKKDIPARVTSIEYDPNRSANIALLFYNDGEKRYILAADSLKVGDELITSSKAKIQDGNRLPLAKIPLGTKVYNVELTPGKGGQLGRSAGTSLQIKSKEGKYAVLTMPSREQRKVLLTCEASIGQVSNISWHNISLGKAGRKRHLGIRPGVRGVAQHPGSHPHGGGEGRSGVGMPSPKSPWGKKTLGKKTRRVKKYSDKYIVKSVKRRKKTKRY